jgi:DNA-binding NarL/FixJ family response regulator
MFMRLIVWCAQCYCEAQYMSQVNAITVALIDDETAIQRSLELLINGTPGYRCTGAFGSIKEGIRSLAQKIPDVLLLDVNLPELSGPEGARLLHEKFPSMQILMLTVYDEDKHIFESICNGASGYLLKRTPPGELLEAIRDVYQGGAPMSPEVARKVVELFHKTGPIEKIERDLTPHEVRVLKLLSEGYSYQATADRLHVSINTIRDYVRSIYDKLHVHSKAAAVRKALRSCTIS